MGTASCLSCSCCQINARESVRVSGIQCTAVLAVASDVHRARAGRTDGFKCRARVCPGVSDWPLAIWFAEQAVQSPGLPGRSDQADEAGEEEDVIDRTGYVQNSPHQQEIS